MFLEHHVVRCDFYCRLDKLAFDLIRTVSSFLG